MTDIPQSNVQPSRRDFLWKYGGGLGGIALASMLGRDGELQAGQTGGMHHTPKAKRVVQLYMSGGASQCDTFDYKPLLNKQHGQPWDPGSEVELFQSTPGSVFASPWKWKQYGQSGKWMSDLVPNLGKCVDDMAFVHSMISKSNIHGPATLMQATGFVLPGFPSMGAWISYALGNLSDELPTFVVLPDRKGLPYNQKGPFSSGFLPAVHQGTVINAASADPVPNLFANKRFSFATPQADRDGLAGEAAATAIRTTDAGLDPGPRIAGDVPRHVPLLRAQPPRWLRYIHRRPALGAFLDLCALPGAFWQAPLSAARHRVELAG